MKSVKEVKDEKPIVKPIVKPYPKQRTSPHIFLLLSSVTIVVPIVGMICSVTDRWGF